MPFDLTMHSKEPLILILDLKGTITSAEMVEHLDAIEAKLAEEGVGGEEKLYLMVDARGVVMSFIDALKGSDTHSSGRRGSSRDPNTYGMFVIDNRDVNLLRDLFRKANPNAEIPMFPNQETAIEYIRQHAGISQE